jgi:uracil-DNA glycosylase
MSTDQNKKFLAEVMGTMNQAWRTFLMSFSDVRKAWLDALNEVGKIHPSMYTPATCDIMRAFHYSSPDKVRVVLVGQDPYPGSEAGVGEHAEWGTTILHADGLCFSSRAKKTPESLKNVFACLVKAGFLKDAQSAPTSNVLEHWAEQDVLMLNTLLTTRRGASNTHKFWLPFTSSVIKHLAESRMQDPLTFMLWGNDAQMLVQGLTGKPHILLKWCHPSPRGQNNLPLAKKFINCDHFKRVNDRLVQNGGVPIVWSPLTFVTAFVSTRGTMEKALAAPAATFTLSIPSLSYKYSDKLEDLQTVLLQLVTRAPAFLNIYTCADIGAIKVPNVAVFKLDQPTREMEAASVKE